MEPPGATLRERFRAWTHELGGDELHARLSKLAPPGNEYGIDPFGLDLDYALAAVAPLLWLYKKYFRVEVHGVERVPAEGRVLLVANHSGQLPFDAAMIGMSLLVERDPPRVMRALVERWVPTLPFYSTLMARLGQVVGTPDNCRRLLAADELLLTFPEGVRGLNKPWSERYRLQKFGRGFMRLALEADVPIVPVGFVGAEEQAPSLANLAPLARLLSMPALPLTPTVIPFPLPARHRIWFGEPLRFEGSPEAEDPEIDGKVARVRAAIEALLARGLAERRGIFR
ncbi:MAG TPA: lysophospholipid acyltransferase family protein [Anaeromyxobacteraceae bacterium]|nr:lysophospholipid acyltransferase family protein [Anaeromyxobacteraceae bacterium]